MRYEDIKRAKRDTNMLLRRVMKESTLTPEMVTDVTKEAINSLMKKFLDDWKDAGSPADDAEVRKIMTASGIPDSLIAAAFKSIGIDVGTDVKQVVKTDDPALDDVVNRIIASDGKDAALEFLKKLKAQKEQEAAITSKKSKTSAPAGDVIKVGDEVIKPNDPRYAALKAAISKTSAPAA